MRNKLLAVAAVAVLVAGALFLPERLLVWGDGQLLDRLHMDAQDQAREGFGESLQLTVPEKLLLLRSGQLTAMNLEQEIQLRAEGEDALTEELARYLQESEQLWTARVEALRGEISSLQTVGGLPEVWRAGSPPDFVARGEVLYLDPDTRMNFQTYEIDLYWEDCVMSLLADSQSGRILSFALHWNQGKQPNWGLRGSTGFGSAWRDYWGMDSVSAGWYSQRVRDILGNMEGQMPPGGEISSFDQIAFQYDGQSLSIPLACQGVWSRSISLTWNR